MYIYQHGSGMIVSEFCYLHRDLVMDTESPVVSIWECAIVSVFYCLIFTLCITNTTPQEYLQYKANE